MPKLIASVASLSHRPTHFDFEDLVGDHPLMRELYSAVDRAARAPCRVLILGESGTGKELVARAVHAHSGVRTGPFVAFNCGTLTADGAVSQLFGHVKGAFTGAHADKEGLFHAAHGGTLFLDEVAELPLVVQAMLLRAIEEGEVFRLGASRPENVQVRVVAATHVDLWEAVRQGRFRFDLLVRLHSIVLHLPSLRERMSDVPRLAEHFLAREESSVCHHLTDAARTKLMEHSFPGNVRELEMVLEGAAMAAGDRPTILPEDLDLDSWPTLVAVSPAANAPAPVVTRSSTPRTLQEVIHDELTDALERNHGNQSQAARELGVSRSTVYWFVSTGEVRVFGKKR
jgi:two-component system, NtrC family, response regulator PilR